MVVSGIEYENIRGDEKVKTELEKKKEKKQEKEMCFMV